MVKKILIWLVIVAAIAAVGYRYYTITQPMVVQMKVPEIATTQEEVTTNPFAVEDLTGSLDSKENDIVYTDYSQSILQQALDDGKKVVLFFHASRCPICRRFDRELTQQLDQVPTDVVILKVNYDTESDLKQQYDIKVQHTLISLDPDGNKIDLTIDPSIETLLGLID